MTELEWHTCPGHEIVKMIHWVGGADYFPNRLDPPVCDRKLLLFACACLRRVWHLLPDERSRKAVEITEEYANGGIDRSRLTSAGHEAGVARDEFRRRSNVRVLGLARASLKMHEAAAVAASGFASQAMTAAVLAAHYSSAAIKHWAKVAGRSARPTAQAERIVQQSLLRDIIGNPFIKNHLATEWLTPTVKALALGIYEQRAFDRLPILADALEEEGCMDVEVLLHCRREGQHVRGCWVVDLILGN